MAKKKVKSAKKSAPKKKSAAASKPQSKEPVQPLADRVLVQRMDVPDKKSAAGIILPDSASKEKSKLGLVRAVGPGRFGDEGDLIPMSVRVGDKVVFNAGWDNEVSMGDDDTEHFLVRETEILAIINK
jgi:chaperonin GroES